MNLEWSDERQKFGKTPIDIETGYAANSDEICVPFERALQHLCPDSVASYRQPGDSEICLGLIDIDRCIVADGSISVRIQKLLKAMDAYAEYSVSGNGIHILCWLADVPPGGHKDRDWDIEVYWERQTIPITGNRVQLADWISPADVQMGTTKYLALHKARFPQAYSLCPQIQIPQVQVSLSADEILDRLFNERQGQKWRDIYNGDWQSYYPSPSDADLALLMKFAFYTSKDPYIMEAMFSACPLSRILIRGTVEKPKHWRKPKWGNKRYRDETIAEAILKTTRVYEGRPKKQSEQEHYAERQRAIRESKKSK